jgi:signal transduction histidine kinase
MDATTQSTSMIASLPGSAPGRRPVLVPTVLVGACILGMTLALWGRPLAQSHFPLTASCALANLLSSGAAFGRAREIPAERRGWQFLGASLALLTLTNLGLAFAFHFPALLPGPTLLGVLGQTLACVSLLLLPWQSGVRRQWARGILGNILFVGSLLLLLWTVTNWSASFHAHDVVNLALLVACARMTLMGGITLVLLERDPRRLHGVLGFVLANLLLGAGYIAVLQHLLASAWSPALPLASGYSLAPLLLGIAAWSRAPLECPDKSPASARVWELLPYAAFALAGAGVLVRFLREGSLPRFPLVGLVALTWLLLLRQFMLLRDLRLQNQTLELRVRQRTQDLEAMQEAVLRTQRLNTVSSLGAGIAHDLNNYLAVIHASAQLMQQEQAPAGSAPDPNLVRIHTTAARAGSLTRRLLKFARRTPEPPTVLDLAAELARMEDLLRMLVPASTRLELDLPEDPCPVRTRRSSLEQILVNLVSNARDAMPDGGAIRVRLQAGPGGGVEILVEDTGPGVPSEVMEHLFELFVTTKGEGKGTGLGLATVKSLVEDDGGGVRVESRPGEGSRFFIHYPVAVAETPAGA